MIPDPTLGAQPTKLHRNPFAILGASITSTRREINTLAEEKLFTLDESIVQDAKRVLTNPVARLEAEVSWIHGLSAATTERVLSDVGLGTQLTSSSEIPPLTRANVLAALLEMWSGQSVRQNWMESQLSTFLHLVDSIDLDSVEESLNVSRSQAQIQEVSRVELIEAMAGQRAYFLNTCQQILNRMASVDQGKCLVQLLIYKPVAGNFLHSLIDEYAFKVTAELETLFDSNKSRFSEILRFPINRRPEIVKVIKAVEVYGQRVRPILLSHEQRGQEHNLTVAFIREVRNLAVELANRHEQYQSALDITLALQAGFGTVGAIHEVLDKDIRALKDLISVTNQYAQQAKVPLVASTNHRSGQAPHRWPVESVPQPPSASKFQTKSPWSRIPGFIKVIAVLMLIGWAGDALSDSDDDAPSRATSSRSSTRGSQSVDQCSNISSWWDDTDARWNRVMELYNRDSQPTLWVETQMKNLIQEQELSAAPSAASDYNDAIVDYMQFLTDTVSGTAPTEYAWDLENDRLFSNVQRSQQIAADSCDIRLIQAITSYSASTLPFDSLATTLKSSVFIPGQSKADLLANAVSSRPAWVLEWA